MKVNNQWIRGIWSDDGGKTVCFPDQTKLPFRLEICREGTSDALIRAIKSMQVRGAPLIGAAGAWAAAFLCREAETEEELQEGLKRIAEARPTAVNLQWAVRRVAAASEGLSGAARAARAQKAAEEICESDIESNRAIGGYFAAIIEEVYRKNGRPVRILTHCNAGWLATVDYGTALSGLYVAQEKGSPMEVWVDETRPRMQGLLTEWELREAGIPCTLIADNAGGYLMQQGEVDLVIVGADRIASNGDVANKVGTYLKALAAKDCGVPFYVAAPVSTVDFSMAEGVKSIPVEERSRSEVTDISGIGPDGDVIRVQVAGRETAVRNIAFDITPARLITGIVTEKGIFAPGAGDRPFMPAPAGTRPE